MNRIAIALLALGLATQATAQDKVDSSKLAKTDRVQLHPGEALKIRGIAMGANDFLASTPALRSEPTAVELVAAEEAHARRIAMYNDGARFDSAPSQGPRLIASDPGQSIDSFESADPESKQAPVEEPVEDSNRYLLPGVLLGLLLYAGRKLTS